MATDRFMYGTLYNTVAISLALYKYASRDHNKLYKRRQFDNIIMCLNVYDCVTGARNLPKVHQRTAQPDDMAVGRGVRETVPASSPVQFRVGPHVAFHVSYFHVLVRSGLGH